MPTVLRVDGYRFFFFSNEGNEPPHIHVQKGDGAAKIWLKQPVELVESKRLTAAELRRIRQLTERHSNDFIQAWRRYFA